MYSHSILVASLCVAAVLAAPNALMRRETVTTSTTGDAGGYYFSCYIESNTGVTMNVGTGSYTLDWSSSAEDVVAGIGWQTGAARYVSFPKVYLHRTEADSLW